MGIWGNPLSSFKGSISLTTLPYIIQFPLSTNLRKTRYISVPHMSMFHLVGFCRWRSKYHTPMKIDNFWSLSQPKRKKDAATMAYMNMILIGTLKDNMNYNIASRNCFLIYYFILFLLHQSLTWMLKFMIFGLFWLMRANGNETEAKLLCRVQIGRREDGSTVAANFEAIFGP